MSLSEKTDLLRLMLSQNARISWEIPHAQHRAEQRQVPRYLAERVLRIGEVRVVRNSGTARERWLVLGVPSGERALAVIVAPGRKGVIRVITVYWKK